jgi:hypothetical protein
VLPHTIANHLHDYACLATMMTDPLEKNDCVGFGGKPLVYYMVYGHEPYEDVDLAKRGPGQLSRRFGHMEFPELNRHEVFDELISACWHNVYPTMALVAYDAERKTRDIALNAECEIVDYTRERKTRETLTQRGLLGPSMALYFRPAWKRYVHAVTGKAMFIWHSLVSLLKRFR